jgi:ABC-type nickel/cobalt efflux system permease component RcnA
MRPETGVLLLGLWGWLVAVQREISAEVARMIRSNAETGDWPAPLVFLQVGIAFGAAHDLTPGHSKTVLALFVAGSGTRLAGRRELRRRDAAAGTPRPSRRDVSPG